MAVDVERIIRSIKQGDQKSVQTQLDKYNTEYSQCFFVNVEERERRKQRELEEFRRNKVREYVPDSDSDFGSDDEENEDLVLRRRLAFALMWFIRTQLQPGVLRACLRTLRIVSRDRQALEPFINDSAILTLARLGGISSLPIPEHEEEVEGEGRECQASACSTSSGPRDGNNSRDTGSRSFPEDTYMREVIIETRGERRHSHKADGIHSMLMRGKRDARGERDEEDEWYDDRELWRKEAIKTLCNVIYNSQRAQERVSALRLLPGLCEKLKDSVRSSTLPSGQFYDLRLLFLLTALRPELRRQLQQAHGVSMLSALLEQSLGVHWAEDYEVVTDPRAPPISQDATQCAIEILKILFNVTYSTHRQEPDEEDGALYRHLAAVLRHCLLLSCQQEELTDELQGHTVNLLSALPLQCLDVLLSVRVSVGSKESGGVNMDCVHSLLLFMERRLDRGQKLKGKLTPVLNFLTETCRAHRETRHYLRQQILPPLREVGLRPEQGDTLRNKLVRLMTHVDTDLKHCAAELLFVLCKENVGRFVKYTGYGNAAGLLAARGLLSGRGPSPQPQYSSDSDSDTEEYREVKDKINVVTGRVEEPQPDPMEGMTEEEKEAEARRLICMFNRLSRNKVIQPMGVTADGRLAPLCGHPRNSSVEDAEEEEVEVDLEHELD
ncbi:synembryn-A [Hoplias malabaricus]|uniref:synembryn-A n=1 Tax=Hoplias malabaricus TaxID=27720 RepID=UPI003462BA06